MFLLNAMSKQYQNTLFIDVFISLSNDYKTCKYVDQERQDNCSCDGYDFSMCVCVCVCVLANTLLRF